jgi:hypothetical protein
MAARKGDVSLFSVQSRLVPRDGLLLLYDIGPESSFLFVVPEAGGDAEVHLLEVPPAAAAPLGVAPGPLTRDMLRRALLGSTGGAGPLQLLGERPSGASGAQTAREEALATGLHALWQVLMPATVWKQVQGRSQVLLIPDGLLHRLPFEALVVARGAHGLADAKFWIDPGVGPPIRYAASAASLAALTERGEAEEGDDVTAGPSILSVSDPDFGRPLTEPRTGSRGAAEARLPKEEFERAGGGLFRLPATADETRALLEVFGNAASAGEVLPLQRGQAGERRVRAALGGKRYIHLATHGIVDERPGGLFAALALTPPAQGPVTSDDDGFLQLFEIYPLKLDCQLAVLSACRTAAGSTQEGEGVFSLARGFLVAGARRVVASLWQVSDRATARLMGDYFRRLAAMETRDSAPRYAEELFAAKQALGRPGPWRDPYYWAPFVLSGEP